MEYQRELEAALEAAALADSLIMKYYADFQAIPDARANITTQADLAAQETILSYLRQRFPTDALCAEEVTPTLLAAARSGPRTWVVDPIDGTRGFAKKLGEFSVMIAFLHEGRSVVGVVQEPATKLLTYARQGGGCWRRNGDAAPERCQVSDAGDLASATLIQSHTRPGQRSWAAQTLGVARVVESYSAGLKMARVARGDVDLYANTYTAFSDWDICAGHVLVGEAGGMVTDLRGRPVTYGGAGAKQTGGMLASNGKVHAAAVERLAGWPDAMPG